MQIALERFSATGGFLQAADIRFTPGLNCVIGARGTCKSTLVESIRFAFNVDQERVMVLLGSEPKMPDLAGMRGMLRETLGGGAVRCDIRDIRNGTAYSVERDAGSPPRVYREGVKDHTETAVLDHVEIYSQGDLQRIAEREVLRLGLIDRPNHARIQHLRQEQSEVAEQLRELGPRLKALRNQAEQLRSSLRALPEVLCQLEDLRANRPQLSSALVSERASFLQRQAAAEASQHAVASRDLAAAAAESVAPHLASLKADLQRIQEAGLPETAPFVERLDAAVTAMESVVAAASVLRGLPLESEQAALAAAFESLSERYYQLRQQEEEANRSLKEEDHLRRQEEHFRGQEQQLEAVDQELQRLQLSRAELRERMRSLAEQIFQIRNSEVDSINQQHGETVILTLEPGSVSDEYISRVQRLLQGSRLRGQDEIGRDLAMSLTPAQIIDIVEAGQTAELASILDRDIGQATRLMSYLLDSDDLYSVEGQIFEDRLNIVLFDEGQPKPVHTLSKGQKATALLPLILREASYPLIFDQPEDDLDNRFIFGSLIRAISELKLKRQLIFVTHNANIPVIGEAETVIVMGMDTPERASPPLHGTVDERQQEIVDLLEGGAAAFRERQRRYAGLLDGSR